MRWTRACGARRLWLNISRSLLGAYKLQRQSGPTSLHPLEMTQALWACFLPGMLYLTVLSQCIRVLGCSVSQATRRCLPLQHAILCPLLAFSYKHQAVCKVWLTARECLFRRAQAWIAGLTGRLRLLQASVPQLDLRAGMVERGPGGDDSSSGEYVDVRLDSEAEGEGGHREPRPGPAGPAGHADQAATAAAKAAPAPGVRVIYDRLGQVVREPTGPPPIVLAVDAAEDEDSESSEHDVDEAAADTDDPGTAPLPHEMEPEFRHVSLAMSNAVCEVLRRNGNRRAEFHVLSIPPAAWKTTEGFVLQALPLTDNTRRHPNLLRCADGPTFAPPRVDEERSEMTDAELADDEEMAALRAEMDAEPAAHMHPSRGTSRRSTATAVPPPPAGHPRTRRQPWPSKYAPPVPTPAQTSAAGDGDESSRPSEDLTMTALTPAARMTNDEVEAAIADLELRTLIDELETEEMEAEASAVNTTSGPTVEPAPGGAASSSSGGTLVPVTPATASTMTSGRPVDTPLRSNRKLGAYLHNGLRTTVVCIVSASHVSLLSWHLHSGAENLTGPSRVVSRILRPRHPQQLLLTWCCRPWSGHWTDCPFATPPKPEGKRKQLSCPTSSCTFTCSISAIPWLARYSPRRTLSITSVALLCSWALCMWACTVVLLVHLCARRYRSTPPMHTGDTIAGASTTTPHAGLAENSDARHIWTPGNDHTPTKWRPVRALQAGPATPLTTDGSRLGPKSQGCCRPMVLRLHPGRCAFLWCFLMLMTLEGLPTAEAAADARVGFIDHRLNPGARTLDIQDTERAKHGENRQSARPISRHPPRDKVRKRALQRAINRADRNPHGQTWYRGKLLHRNQLGSGNQDRGRPLPRQAESSIRADRRLRIVTWNAGGLMDTRYQEVLAWLAAEAQAGHPVDVLTLQETCWKQDLEYRTSCGPTDEAYHVVHSTGGDKSGIMIMIRQGLLPAHGIQYVPLVPGRVVHLRLRFSTPLDILCLYQVSWNVAKSTLEGHKVTALLKQRARIWRHVEQWLRATPGRHGCLIVGDLNTPLTPEPGVCGPVPLVQNIAQQDQAELQAILRTYVCCALNSWTGTGAKARTFLPPTGDQTLQGTRIDFVIARGDLIDNEAKKAGVISAPFVPTSGARHRPVQAKIRLPSRPKPGAHPSSGRQPAQVCRQLRNPQVEAGLARNLSTLMDQSNPDADLDDLLLQGWEMTRSEDPGQHGRHELAPQQGLAVRHRIQHMWQLRASIRGNQPRTDDAGDLPSLASIWKAWIQVARLQACTRQLRKDCRRHKTLKIYEAVQAENVYAAAKQFAPRQVRRKLQLRTKDGQLMSHEQEFQCIKDYFTRLYHGPNPQPVALSQAVQFEPAEVQVAILKLSAGKAMPQHSAPAALWRTSVGQVASRLCSQINSCLGRGCHLLPERWSTSDMALIPKPGKAMTSPEQLRPISLLPMPAKALGSMLAERLHAHAYRYLQGIPQYAYMKGRHLGMALDRVASHCISTRRLLQDQANNLHARRSGRRAAQVCGGCMLSLDLSKAYDHVPWEDLACALRDAEVPPQLVELIILLHQQARIRITHHEQTELLRMYRGLRQGCSLAPALWTIYSGWLLKGLHATGEVDIPESNTSYADDFHFCWQVLRASDMERSYRAMRTVLQGLEERHVQVSLEKTVAIIDLQGPGAKKCLDRYLVRRPRCEGLFLKFMIAGEARYVKVKPSHTYLGVSISYKKPEQETAKLRLDLATGTFRRLKKILACRDVPLKLRLQLWQGTVLPTMLHGVDSMGLPLKEANQIMIVYFKQVRSVAKSFSMFTHETNQDLAKRLGLADPLQRLLQALDRRSCASKDLPEQLLPGPVQQQWRLFVRSQLAEARDACGTRTGPKTQQRTSLILVQDILHEQHECKVCGQVLATAAALKRHMFRQHLDEDTQLATIQENRRKLRGNELVHAQSGMPQCRHCKYKFTTWHAFFYHINSRGCSILRALYEKDSHVIVAESLNEAVVNDVELLQMTQSCTWKDIAMHPKVRANHQHCPECHMWTVRHQYIKQHMLQKHPEQTAIIEQSEQLIVRSDLSIGNPCQFCGLSYTRKTAHLKSCIGLFNGVYLYLRIARGPVLTELSGQHGYGHGGRQEQTSVRGGHPRAGAPGGAQPDGQPSAGNAFDSSRPTRDGIQQTRAGAEPIGQSRPGPPATEVPQRRCQGQPGQPRSQGQRSRTWTKPELEAPRGTIKHFLERTTRTRKPGTAEVGATESQGPMERGGAGPVRAGGVSGYRQDVDNDDVTARGPVCDSETRHVVRCVYPNWLPRQCRSVNASHSSELACHEDGHPRETGGPHASHPFPALHQDGPGQVGANAANSVIQVDGGQSGPALGERGGSTGDEVGPREPKACPGHEPPTDEGDRGGKDIADDPAKMHHPARDLPVPRHEETGTGVPRRHPDDATRGGLANQGGQRGLERSTPHGEIQCMGDGGHLPQARGHATECTRQTPRDAELVKQLRLSNGGNYCYSNAGVKGLLYAMAFQGGTKQFFSGGMLQLFESIMRQSGATHLWRHPFWVAMMSGWRRPSRQHDGAEFLQFMLTKHQHAADQVLIHWQARKPGGDSWICVDHGSSAPLLVHPPETAECTYMNVTDSCSVQTLVEHWQASFHACRCAHAAHPDVAGWQI